MTNDERKARGHQARRLLDDQTLAEAFEEIHAGLVDKFINTEPQEVPTRDRAYYEIKALAAVKDKLNAWVEDGKLAARDDTQAEADRQARQKGDQVGVI